VLISVSIWCISIYNGWLKEALIFGYNIFNIWVNPQISWNDNVTTIKYGEYAYRLLYDISIPENITAIESNAFKGNKLMSITIGSNVYLGENAFGFDFEDVYNNNGMKGGTYTRDYYKNTEWIAWDENFGYKINNENNLTITGYKGSYGEIIIPNEINGRKVTIIADRAFREKRLIKVTIPASVTSIGEGAFQRNRLTSVNIPDNVTSIGRFAFAGNRITNITISANVNLMSGAFENRFSEFYNSFGRAGGTYVLDSNIWIRK